MKDQNKKNLYKLFSGFIVDFRRNSSISLIHRISPKFLSVVMNLWPPFWFTGISYRIANDDMRDIHVRMPLRFYNKNVVGIHYGGNLFSMTDPIYMVMLMRNLGNEYKVIDQSAAIEFISPGLNTVSAHCQLTQEDIDDILKKTIGGEKYLKTFWITLVDEVTAEEIARVERVVYIRKIVSRRA